MSLTDDSSVVPVVSLLLFRDATRQEVLLGLRRAPATSPRHPNVLSTPTTRVPMSIMSLMLSAERINLGATPGPWFRRLDGARSWKIGIPLSLTSVEAFTAEALITRKLGLADELIDGRLTGDLSFMTLARDRIYDEVGGEQETLMLTMGCDLSERVDLVCDTASYSRLEWVPADQIGDAVKSRDPLMLLPDASVFEVCLHGLCVRSAAYAIESEPLGIL
jgi:hypothetical protein